MCEEIPFYEQPLVIRRQRLINNDFSIICQNCVAGFIYHQLGLKFLTPTINLYFYPGDFLHFVQNLHYYLSDCPLVEDQLAPQNFPVGLLGDAQRQIRIYFNHDSTFEAAKAKWERRKQRVNYQQLYVIGGDAYGQPYSTAQLRAFDQLPFQNKVLFTGAAHPEIKSAYQIDHCVINGHLGQWWDHLASVRGSRLFEQFDYVSFLNNYNEDE
ncbi:DUF1919 domain-containing protein [uncultured Limosilactobacillus sp.]|uniref:DUF1919 domain-containing protein n=1 Tax=uncultured Limosilactobacillus sp. TaxID=2837629 RepID=UPI0025D20DA1|nr:DUF1919 domain-containing protein [uncultured Limosilactobacillus sp.]